MKSQNMESIYAVVRRIPKGCIATYGQVAMLAGLARHARQVGYALGSLPENSDVPWQRVVNAKGEISSRSDPYGKERQRFFLKKDGITFDANGRISLERFGWKIGMPISGVAGANGWRNTGPVRPQREEAG